MDAPKAISTLYRKMTSAVNTRLSTLGISNAKAMFLFCLRDKGGLTQIEICRELKLDKSSVAKMLVRLEEDGLVTKKMNPADERSFLVTLTARARRLVPKAQEVVSRWFDEATACLSAAEKARFCALLERVTDAAGEIEQEG